MSVRLHVAKAFDEAAKTIEGFLFSANAHKKQFAQEAAQIIEELLPQELKINVPMLNYSQGIQESDIQTWFIERYFELLYAANRESAFALYGSRALEIFGSLLTEKYACELRQVYYNPLELIDLAQRMHSLEYNSDGSPNWENSPVGQMTKRIIGSLEHTVVVTLKEYELSNAW